MLNFFGLPILISFIVGYFFPYIALTLSPYAFVVLFFMMTSSFIEINWSSFKKISQLRYELLIGLFFLFLFFPLLQWLLTKLFISEESLCNGVLLASLSPVAIVSPNFTRIYKGDTDLSFLLLILSMLLFPLFVWLALTITPFSIHLRPIVLDMSILVFFPALISIIIKWIDNKIFKDSIIVFWSKFSAEFNMLAIAFLAFIYLGASVSKLNLNYILWKELLGVLVVVTFQDFGVFFVGRSLMRHFFEEKKACSLAISLSMKNFAIAGAILLFYDPKSSLASAMGFFIHALFFNFLIFNKSKNELHDPHNSLHP